MTIHAIWDDGHPVRVPGRTLAAFEIAWRDVQPWQIAHKFPDPLADDPAYLDHVEQHLLEEVVRGATKNRRALLTNTGPVWTAWPVPLSSAVTDRADFDEAAAGFEVDTCTCTCHTMQAEQAAQ
jgi:hypothetical protein